jgi:hypothetical protein
MSLNKLSDKVLTFHARFESSECPGYIDAIKSYDKEGAYHPLGKEGFPVFDVYLDEDGNIIT